MRSLLASFSAYFITYFLALASCTPATTPAVHGDLAQSSPTVEAGASTPAVQLALSVPVETELDVPGVAQAHEAWKQLFDRATQSIDLGQFYVSNDQPHKGRLEPILAALEAAAARKVRVRLLVDDSFYAKYPESVERLGRAGVVTRRYDVKKLMGGVLHAKYFIVDCRVGYVGSQNFDYRSLEHIHETGAIVSDAAVVAAISHLFEDDFRAAAANTWQSDLPNPAPAQSSGSSPPAPASVTATVTVAMSPERFVPAGVPWDLPLLVSAIDGAKRHIRIQLLTYKRRSRDGTDFVTLDQALRRAAARGVRVTLLVSHWNAKEPSLYELAQVPNIEVAIVTIPAWSGGEIPFARVTHSKYMIVDEARAWLGTSNWEGDYFTQSRNVSLFVTDATFVRDLERVFLRVSASPYAVRVRPGSVAPASAPAP